MEILIYILSGLVLIEGIYIIILKGRLTILQRAIAIANQKVNFIEKIEHWSDKKSLPPFTKDIDPHDVYTELWDANNRGLNSLKKEMSKYGNIEQI